MNRHEHLYRKTGWILIVLFGMWIALMLLALAIPARAWKSGPTSFIFFDGIMPLLFLAAVSVGIVRIRSYVLWTGKHPYYFLFGKLNKQQFGKIKKREKEQS
jgi:hypothetical protein